VAFLNINCCYTIALNPFKFSSIVAGSKKRIPANQGQQNFN
jgi:hypothetical protein